MAPRGRIHTRAAIQARQHPVTFSLLLLFSMFAQYAAAAPSITSAGHSPDSGKQSGSTTQAQLTEGSFLNGVRTSSSAQSLIPRDQQTPGSSCPGSEGQWNCMSNSWQRCAAGKWSVVMQCAAETACVPAGFTYDFKVQFSGQSTGTGSSAIRGKPLELLWPLLLVAAVSIAVMLYA